MHVISNECRLDKSCLDANPICRCKKNHTANSSSILEKMDI